MPTLPDRRIRINTITPAHLVKWLGQGWGDIWRCGWLSLLHGVACALFGAILIWLAHDRFWLLAGAFSGFLVIAPVLATSLYTLSRAREYGLAINKRVLLNTWLNWQTYRKGDPKTYWVVLRFGILLAIAATGWVLCSAALITLMAPSTVNTPVDFLYQIVLAREGLAFELWMVLGGLLAAPIFASTAIAIPLMLDRHVTLSQAVETSWRAVLVNPITMAIWAGIIMGVTLFGMVTMMVGLAIALPWIGHSTWYAYRDLVDASTLPLRDSFAEIK